jgi:hypothetical protein
MRALLWLEGVKYTINACGPSFDIPLASTILWTIHLASGLMAPLGRAIEVLHGPTCSPQINAALLGSENKYQVDDAYGADANAVHFFPTSGLCPARSIPANSLAIVSKHAAVSPSPAAVLSLVRAQSSMKTI